MYVLSKNFKDKIFPGEIFNFNSADFFFFFFFFFFFNFYSAKKKSLYIAWASFRNDRFIHVVQLPATS